ncbi:hypothetical protein [Agrococcus sp. KRD186]|uniref:hypothetical protein n=1 Tax=Agrococcus sp. KRD186 TaxID=2729730 RepID=UPI0019D2398F|nr:hypothetical protein [Agrococcus sp. KRD186]
MSRPSLRIRHRLLPVTIVAAVTALALTGCEPGVLAPTDSPDPSTGPTVTAEPTETTQPTEPGATETPGQTDTPEVTTPPVAGDLPCTDVFTADQLYAFNPNFAPSSDQGELPGAIADIADAGGTVCAYQHVTGSDRLVIGVLEGMGDFDAPEFESVGEIGVASAQTDGSVVAAASIYFVEARDAQQVLDEVSANVN